MEIKEALKEALAFEQKGHDLYEEAASKSDNPLVKKTFNYLAEQEIHHVNEIKDYIERSDDLSEIELKGDTLKETQKFFTMTIGSFKEKTKLSDDDIKVHETALTLEQSAYDFYKEQYEKTENVGLKKFFKWLMDQENAHYEFIQKAYDYIKDPVGFYTEEEGWMADGG